MGLIFRIGLFFILMGFMGVFLLPIVPKLGLFVIFSSWLGFGFTMVVITFIGIIGAWTLSRRI